MKKYNTLRLTVLTMLVIALGLLASPAAVLAQAPTSPAVNQNLISCTASAANSAEVNSVYGNPEGGIDYAPPVTLRDPKPENPVQKSCENGKITIVVGNEQQFGNRIGGLVEIRILVLIADGVTIDFTTLQRGILKFEGRERFYLAHDNPVRINKGQQNDKTLYTLSLRIQTFVPEPSVPFNLDLRYSTSFVKDTVKPDWKVLTTPDFAVTTSNTVDNGEDLKEGNMDVVDVARPWPIKALFYTGAFLVLLWPVVALVMWLIRRRPGYQPPKNEVAWTTFSRVFQETDQFGYKEHHYRHLVDALKDYLGVGTRTREEISTLLKDDPRHSTIISALKKCDEALYAGKGNRSAGDLLSKDDLTELIEQIKAIVPKPE